MGCGTSVAHVDAHATFAINSCNCYRDTLGEAEQELYDKILEGYRSFAASINAPLSSACQSKRAANRVNQAVLLDHPEVFHTYIKTVRLSETDCVMEFAPFDANVVALKAALIEEAIATFFMPYYRVQEEVGRTSTELGCVQVVVEWLVSYGRYEALPESDMTQFTIEGFFLKRCSACEGFAKAYQLLCQRVGVTAICIRGDYGSLEKTALLAQSLGLGTVDQFTISDDVGHQYDHIYTDAEAGRLAAAASGTGEGGMRIETGNSAQTDQERLALSTPHGVELQLGESDAKNTGKEKKGKDKDKKEKSKKEGGDMKASKMGTDVAQSASNVLTMTKTDLLASEANPLGVTSSQASRSVRHTWCMTKLEGVWYHSDVLLCLRGMVDTYIPSSFLRMSREHIIKMGLRLMTLVQPFVAEGVEHAEGTYLLKNQDNLVADVLTILTHITSQDGGSALEEGSIATRPEVSLPYEAAAEPTNIFDGAPEEKGYYSMMARVGGLSRQRSRNASMHIGSAFAYTPGEGPIWDESIARVQSVNESMGGLGIPTMAYAYAQTHTARKETTSFMTNRSLLTQASAHEGAQTYHPDARPDTFASIKEYSAIGGARQQLYASMPTNAASTAKPGFIASSSILNKQPGEESMMYNHWKKSRMNALKSAFADPSSPRVSQKGKGDDANAPSFLSGVGTREEQHSHLTRPMDMDSIAKDPSLFVGQGAGTPVVEESVEPQKVLASAMQQTLVEFALDLELDWGKARQVLKSKMPFISSTLASRTKYRVSNYTVEKFVCTVALEPVGKD
ncbi:hypothetical protein GMRT_12352 [Giardia muris]|uniref:Transglutaminase-like superfamily protein n=1 Tax=Giardia muris TaxID=5742 RepID=A0A4Z1SNE6_GIAMU|nr:hypothetical protein GMRT_12352 [Giardia muris]|eukprot:TNJ27292.1 hypothetical protein GMRT_12352 [Giardia muris]